MIIDLYLTIISSAYKYALVKLNYNNKFIYKKLQFLRFHIFIVLSVLLDEEKYYCYIIENTELYVLNL